MTPSGHILFKANTQHLQMKFSQHKKKLFLGENNIAGKALIQIE